MTIEQLYPKAVELLQQLIQTPSFSKEEDQTAALIEKWFSENGIPFHRSKNNVWAKNKYFDENKPSILLNSHHDTVRPNQGYSRDPFHAEIKGDHLYGLGSNDAGASLVSLISTFTFFYDLKDLKYNLVIAATAEEENSGTDGLLFLMEELPEIDFAIVGEPTEMHMAISEKGLLVIDGYAPGISGHAAHENTENAIYNAIEDINWIRNFVFPKISDTLGKVKMTVSVIQAGQQHNVVPATCHFIVDVRVSDAYSNEEVFAIIDRHTKSKMIPRSFRLNSSSIPSGHPIVLAGVAIGRNTYGSPTLSDQSILKCPSLKMGPGNSLRSHQADEYILLSEIREGMEIYTEVLSAIL